MIAFIDGSCAKLLLCQHAHDDKHYNSSEYLVYKEIWNDEPTYSMLFIHEFLYNQQNEIAIADNQNQIRVELIL